MKIQEIAKRAGVSTATVSRVFSNHPNIREELRLLAAQRSGLLEKVHAAQKKVDCLDYLVFNMKQENTTNSRR